MKVQPFYLAAALGLASAAGILGAVATKHGALSDTMGTWVQGIGTLAAFAAAIWAGQVPMRLERERKRDKVRDFARAISDCIELAARTVGPALMHVENRELAGIFSWQMGTGFSDALRPVQAMLSENVVDWPSHLLFVRTERVFDTIQQFVGVMAGRAGRIDLLERQDNPDSAGIEATWREIDRQRKTYEEALNGFRLTAADLMK